MSRADARAARRRVLMLSVALAGAVVALLLTHLASQARAILAGTRIVAYAARSH